MLSEYPILNEYFVLNSEKTELIAWDHLQLFILHVFRLYLHTLSCLQYDCKLLWLIGVKMQPAESDVESSLLLTGWTVFLGFYCILIV